jgi:HTH-type transcriptional regulator/antitoxin HigA
MDDGSDDDSLETVANQFAADILIPPDHARRLPTLTSNSDVIQFADDIGVAPGIVVGRLHRERLWEWNKGNDLRAAVKIVAS